MSNTWYMYSDISRHDTSHIYFYEQWKMTLPYHAIHTYIISQPILTVCTGTWFLIKLSLYHGYITSISQNRKQSPAKVLCDIIAISIHQAAQKSLKGCQKSNHRITLISAGMYGAAREQCCPKQCGVGSEYSQKW